MLLKVDCLPNAVLKQPSIPLIYLGRNPGEAASSPHRGPRVNAQMMTSLPSPLPSPPYPLLIESVQPKLAPEGIPIHFSGSASADQGIDIASVS